MIKKIGLFIVVSCLIWGTARFCHRETQGFRLTKISENFAPVSDWEIPPLASNELAEVERVLDQKFTYFSRGFQSFVFLSEDGKVVLKVFSNAYQWRERLIRFVPPLSLLASWKQKKLENCHTKLHKTFQSYKIAYENLKDQTGLLFVHLDRSRPFNKTVALVDKLGIQHRIDLHNTGFLLQKRVEQVYPTLDRLLSEGKIEQAKQRLDNLLNLMVERNKMGIADSDPLIRTNFGFLGDQAIHIDVGPFSQDPSVRDPEVFLKEMSRITVSLRHWLENNHPELVSFLAEKMQKLHDREATQ